jgi:hypothetical protein
MAKKTVVVSVNQAEIGFVWSKVSQTFRNHSSARGDPALLVPSGGGK